MLNNQGVPSVGVDVDQAERLRKYSEGVEGHLLPFIVATAAEQFSDLVQLQLNLQWKGQALPDDMERTRAWVMKAREALKGRGLKVDWLDLRAKAVKHSQRQVDRRDGALVRHCVEFMETWARLAPCFYSRFQPTPEERSGLDNLVAKVAVAAGGRAPQPAVEG